MTDRIMIVCEVCGRTDEEIKSWRPRCLKHGGPVCSECCIRCEDHVEFSGLYKCNYKSIEERKAAARRRSQERLAVENARISEAFIRDRQKAARKRAIKNIQAKKREEAQRRKQYEEVGRAQKAPQDR